MNERASTGIRGLDAFYVFDSLTFLLQTWHSDLMIGNFFQVTCPYLYELNTIAYFALIRNAHTYDTIARLIGELNRTLKEQNLMLIGPDRRSRGLF